MEKKNVKTFDPLRSKARAAVYAGVSFLFGLGLASGLGWTSLSHAMPRISDEPPLTEAQVQPALDLSEAFVNIANAVTPGVVRIEVERPAPRMTTQIPDFPWPFGDPPQGFERSPRELPDSILRRDPEPIPQRAGGSGFLISENGYILTNDHVIDQATRIDVVLHDGRRFQAEVVGTDPLTDVAVVKIDETGLPSLSFGSSDGVRVGEWVVAVGNPGFRTGRTLDYTVTQGIVSAKGRPLQILGSGLDMELQSRAIENFIQSDAVVNPGNSGGPLVNLRGQVIGITSAIATTNGFYQGYSFAIPIDLAREVMEDLIEYGRVRRAQLGVSIMDVTPELADDLDLPSVGGTIVTEVTPGTPADGKIQPYDVIAAVDDQEVGSPGHLQELIARRDPGETVSVTVFRDGERREIPIRLGEANLTPAAPVSRPTEEASTTETDRLGIQVGPLGPQAAERYGFAESGGVVITDVTPGGPAYRASLGPGWKIIEMERQEVEAPEDVERILAGVEPGEVVSILAENRLQNRRIFAVRVPN